MIPSLELLSKYPTRDLAPEVVAKLAPGLPNIQREPKVVEICLKAGGVPRFDCAQFAMGAENARLLMPELVQHVVHELRTRFGLVELAAVEGKLGLPGAPVIALFAKNGVCGSGKGDVVKHVALTHLDAKGELPSFWASKLGPDYPAIRHHLSQLGGGDYGDVVAFFSPTQPGSAPYWLDMCAPP